ncbi:DUF1653 domain-containing protein [Candidatus Saccharibacteria bacterium]|nr:DUF1653 domain-containing protein [Candidatus Saccharibacteria bacterium]
MSRSLKVNGVYRHFKGKKYRVEGIAKYSEDLSDYVIYRQMYGDGELYVRPLDMFMSEVDHERYPDVQQKWRFEEVEAEEL